MRDLKFKLGTLLPEADHVFIEWLKYWKALPPASLRKEHEQFTPEIP
jgi:hypothetical protein